MNSFNSTHVFDDESLYSKLRRQEPASARRNGFFTALAPVAEVGERGRAPHTEVASPPVTRVREPELLAARSWPLVLVVDAAGRRPLPTLQPPTVNLVPDPDGGRNLVVSVWVKTASAPAARRRCRAVLLAPDRMAAICPTPADIARSDAEAALLGLVAGKAGSAPVSTALYLAGAPDLDGTVRADGCCEFLPAPVPEVARGVRGLPDRLAVLVFVETAEEPDGV